MHDKCCIAITNVENCIVNKLVYCIRDMNERSKKKLP